MYKKVSIIIVLLTLSFTSSVFAQDKQELEAEQAANKKLKGESVLVNLMKTKNSSF